MTISILHPSRSRPEKSKQTIKKWIANADRPELLETIVSIDSSDPKRLDYDLIYLGNWVIINNNKSAVDAINRAAEVCTGDIMIVVSDDTDCFDGWDTALREVCKGKSDFILKCKDGIQDWIITMPVMDRVYYNRFGYVYYPEFKHMFCDTFLTCVADLTGRKIECDLLFPHRHYSVGQSQKDDVSIKADSTWQHGEKLFFELASKNFLLKPEEVKGRITSQQYINWMKSKGLQVA